MYDPTIGQWISEDPIGFAANDSNLRRYVSASPVSFRDPTGHEKLLTEVANKDKSTTITFKSDYLIVVLFGHGNKATPHTFNFGKFKNVAAAFIGCDAGTTNGKLGANMLPGSKLTDGEIVSGTGIGKDKEDTVLYWKKIAREEAKKLADKWLLTAPKGQKVTVRFVLAGDNYKQYFTQPGEETITYPE